MAEHGPMVMRVCRALLGHADAGDAWSETFLSAMQAYPKLPPSSNIRGWLVTIIARLNKFRVGDAAHHAERFEQFPVQFL